MFFSMLAYHELHHSHQSKSQLQSQRLHSNQDTQTLKTKSASTEQFSLVSPPHKNSMMQTSTKPERSPTFIETLIDTPHRTPSPSSFSTKPISTPQPNPKPTATARNRQRSDEEKKDSNMAMQTEGEMGRRRETGNTHPLNYYLVYCPVAMTVSWLRELKEERMLRREFGNGKGCEKGKSRRGSRGNGIRLVGWKEE